MLGFCSTRYIVAVTEIKSYSRNLLINLIDILQLIEQSLGYVQTILLDGSLSVSIDCDSWLVTNYQPIDSWSLPSTESSIFIVWEFFLSASDWQFSQPDRTLIITINQYCYNSLMKFYQYQNWSKQKWSPVWCNSGPKEYNPVFWSIIHYKARTNTWCLS